MISKGDAREALMLWLPSNPESDLEGVMTDYLPCRQAIEDFLDLKIDPITFAEIVDGYGVNLDGYLDDVSFNLLHL